MLSRYTFSKDIKTEMVPIEELFGFEAKNKSTGNPVLIERPVEPNDYTPKVEATPYIFKREDVKAVLAGLMHPREFRMRLTGLYGTGKTTVIERVLNKLNWGLRTIPCYETLEFQEMIGYNAPCKDGLKWIPGQLYQHLKETVHPIAICFEEMDALSPNLLLALNPILDGLPIEVPENNERLIPALGNPFFSTGNTVNGYDQRGIFDGVHRQNTSSISRWIIHEVDYLSSEQELGLLNQIVQDKISDQSKQRLVEFGAETRQAAKGSLMERPFSTRELLCAVKYSLQTADLTSAVAAAYWFKLNPADRDIADKAWVRNFGVDFRGNERKAE
jgi:hypothetical protein